MILAVGYSYKVFIMYKKFPFIPDLLRIFFIMKRSQTLSNVLSASIEMIIQFLIFIG
jgi:hypothetical protein